MKSMPGGDLALESEAEVIIANRAIQKAEVYWPNTLSLTVVLGGYVLAIETGALKVDEEQPVRVFSSGVNAMFSALGHFKTWTEDPLEAGFAQAMIDEYLKPARSRYGYPEDRDDWHS